MRRRVTLEQHNAYMAALAGHARTSWRILFAVSALLFVSIFDALFGAPRMVSEVTFALSVTGLCVNLWRRVLLNRIERILEEPPSR